ncbi:PQQ-dependent sugar dehydrogenase [Natronorubrum sp. FCH18a]|uniref:PQQ-dependent sugar dehydrogenase n=1 Tax=Natronorubrum sp. FCH18a TaxID=3447018 RepID=UPI003F51342B
MSYPNDTVRGVHESGIGSQSRRTILRALAASGSAAALGGVASAQEDEETGEEEAEEADFEGVPVAGEFPEGETVGLQLVAENLPAPTDLDYVEVDGEVHHFLVTQTGQVFVTNLGEQPEEADGGPEEDGAPDEAVDEEEDGPVAADDAEGELDEDGAEGESVEADNETGVADPNNETGVADPDNETDVAEAEEGSLIQEENETGEPPEADEGNETADPNEGVVADDDGEDTMDQPAEGEPQEFLFNGVVTAWFGMGPDEIDGEENPTLELAAGETYRFTWENGDGQPHNVVILDANDDILERTEIVREAGETQTLEFEATEEMDRYVCEVHPGTMSGSIQVEGEAAEDAGDATSLTPDDMELFLDIEDQLVTLGIGELGGYDERGLLGIAFHPEYAENGRFYVRYSAPERDGLGYNHTDVLAEFQAEDDLTSVNPDSERTIMEIPQPQDNHNGGRLAFGPDGYLYTSVGDGGNVHDIGVGHVDDWYDENEGGNAQNTTENPLGGIHRIDVDAEEEAEFGEYGVPDDNPLVDSDEDIDSYWAWGFRNPWGMSIDDGGQVFVSDAGQHHIESVYTVDEGGNYSWNVKEGSFCFSPEFPLEAAAECPDEVEGDVSEARAGEPLRDPIAEYQHTRVSEAFIDSSVVVGGHRYAGDTIPELEGEFVFGNWSSQGVAEADGEVLVAVDPAGDGADEDEVDAEEQDEGALEDEAEANETENEAEANDTEDGVEANTTEEASLIQEADDEGADPDENETEDDAGLEDDADAGDDLVEVDEGWDLEELQFEGADDESLNRYVYGVERDENGELYVLANTDFRPDPETGEVYRIVPAEEGEEIPAPEDPFVVDEEEMEEEAPEAEAPDGADEEGEEFPEGEDDPGADEELPDDNATADPDGPDNDTSAAPDDADEAAEPGPQEADD